MSQTVVKWADPLSTLWQAQSRRVTLSRQRPIVNIRDQLMPLSIEGRIWDFDLAGWTLGEDALYIHQVIRVRQTGDYRPLFPHWARMIRHWPLPLDPGKITSYVGLDPALYAEIV